MLHSQEEKIHTSQAKIIVQWVGHLPSTKPTWVSSQHLLWSLSTKPGVNKGSKQREVQKQNKFRVLTISLSYSVPPTPTYSIQASGVPWEEAGSSHTSNVIIDPIFEFFGASALLPEAREIPPPAAELPCSRLT